MIELNDYISFKKIGKPKEANISLSGTLEFMIGKYSVSGEGNGNFSFHWLTIYYDPDIDIDIEAFELTPEKIVAYVSSDYRWGFVLDHHFRKFMKDISDYDISCVPMPSFHHEILQCSHTDLLPTIFSNITWINDDFMKDENLPFDYDSFSIIDTGVPYLNPKHFSVVQFIQMINH